MILGAALLSCGRFQMCGMIMVSASLRMVPSLSIGMAPRWTPDSQYIVFAGLSAQGNFDLILRNRDGSYRRELTDDPAVEWFCEISPQGDKVAYGKCITDPFPLDLCVLDITYASVRETT